MAAKKKSKTSETSAAVEKTARQPKPEKPAVKKLVKTTDAPRSTKKAVKKAAKKVSARAMPTKKGGRRRISGTGLETIEVGAGAPAPRPAIESTTPAVTARQIRYLTDDEVKAELGARWGELSKQRVHAEEILSRHAEFLKSLPEVRGFHVGLWKKDNKVVSPLEYCISVHVVEKLDKRDARLEKPLPPEIEGIRVDVIQQSYQSTAGLREVLKVNPILGGISIANVSMLPQFGTLGLCVFSKISGSQPRYLTNQHVVGDRGNVVQPPTSNDVIGEVIDSERSSLIDAALILPTGNRTFDVGVIGPNGKRLKANLVPGSLNITDEKTAQCFLIGAMSGTGNEFGTVESINTRINIEDYGWMENQIIVDPPANASVPLIQKGDSGAVLIKRFVRQNRVSMIVVGLVHAMTDTGGIVASHLSPVLERFGIGLSDIESL